MFSQNTGRSPVSDEETGTLPVKYMEGFLPSVSPVALVSQDLFVERSSLRSPFGKVPEERHGRVDGVDGPSTRRRSFTVVTSVRLKEVRRNVYEVNIHRVFGNPS